MPDFGNIILASMERAPWGWVLTVTVILALIKVWPVLALQAEEARSRLRKERRDDLNDCHQRIAALTIRIDGMAETMNNLKIELASTLSAYRILDVETERRDPGSIGLAEARAILSTAFTVAPSTHPAQ